MLHDLPDGDALGRVWGEHTAEQRLAVRGHVQRLLEFRCHDAWEHLLQADQVVASVVPPLGKWQHTYKGDTYLRSGRPRSQGRNGRNIGQKPLHNSTACFCSITDSFWKVAVCPRTISALLGKL